MVTLSTPTAQVAFPAGAVDGPWNFTLTGTNADGSDYNDTFDSDASTATRDVPAGATVTLVVLKNGIYSLPSDPFTAAGGPVNLTVPDAAQKATISA